jgi:hypothetical protein
MALRTDAIAALLSLASSPESSQRCAIVSGLVSGRLSDLVSDLGGSASVSPLSVPCVRRRRLRPARRLAARGL